MKKEGGTIGVSWIKKTIIEYIYLILESKIRANKTSITKIKRYAEIGSPWWAPLFNWKYCVVFPILMTQDSDLFKMA